MDLHCRGSDVIAGSQGTGRLSSVWESIGHVVEVSRAARAAGAKEVVLYTNAANPTSNALYQRLGYVRVTDWAVYDFSGAVPDAG